MTPHLPHERMYLMMLIGLIGTTIAPWMQFYQQASVVEKHVSVRNYNYSRIDTIFGGITVSLVALFIVVVCSETLFVHAVRIDMADQAAKALAPLAGRFASLLFAVGLLNASLFAASILPISTSYTICEAMGWESGLDRKFDEAKQFYVLYTALIVLGGLISLLPNSAADSGDVLVAGGERDHAAVYADSDSADRQQQAADGDICQQPSVQYFQLGLCDCDFGNVPRVAGVAVYGDGIGCF